jgi:hypothetical protein
MIIWQAGSAIDSCQSARAERQAHFDPDRLIQQPWALAVQEAPVVNTVNATLARKDDGSPFKSVSPYRMIRGYDLGA